MIEPELCKNAITVLEKRYLKKDEAGRLMETPKQMFERVARAIANIEIKYGKNDKEVEKYYQDFYEMMATLKFLPNSPCLMNAGTDLGQLAACFVLPVEDSLEDIFNAIKNAALVSKSGGGTGFSFSKLRSKNSIVGSTGGVASGPVSFMKIFDAATEEVKQGGRRRGANMGVLDVHHPDILEFIDCKLDGTLSNFNISVALTDDFMGKVSNNLEYDLIEPSSKKVVGKLKAGDVFDQICQNSHSNGDPGIIFIDEINRHNPTPFIGEIKATNPCGEIPLLPNEACNLGSINLAKFVKDGEINWAGLNNTTRLAVRFLDNVVDVSKYPLPAIDKAVKDNRKIGLGVMGFADVLMMLNIPYNSPEACDLGEDIMSYINDQAYNESNVIAGEKSVFPNWSGNYFEDNIRNATRTTIAPTGTLSLIANCSSGIEPVFALGMTRNVMDGEKLVEVNKYLEKYLKSKGWHTKEIIEKIVENNTTTGIIDDEVLNSVYITAHDVEPEWHVNMQASFQKYVNNSISKTVNMSHDATVEDVRKVYMLAYESKCKGITIYRDGSKKNQVLTITKKDETIGEVVVNEEKVRPNILNGFIARIKTGVGKMYVSVSECDGKPYELFATIGKCGKSVSAKSEAIGRLISLALRSGIEVGDIIEQLEDISGEHAVFSQYGLVKSIPDGIAKVLKMRYNTTTVAKNIAMLVDINLCPDCGSKIAIEEGCEKCYSCGFSKCG